MRQEPGTGTTGDPRHGVIEVEELAGEHRTAAAPARLTRSEHRQLPLAFLLVLVTQTAVSSRFHVTHPLLVGSEMAAGC
jgi:hypothetical protein